ncbi:MAG: hypothetical protein IT376_21855 [Polyangiaceae bacterium]|nr:hypothetical protein [Polyangiaceae bacterium]
MSPPPPSLGRRLCALARVEARSLRERTGARVARALGWSLLLGHGVALGVVAAAPGGRALVDGVAAAALGSAALWLGGLTTFSVVAALGEGPAAGVAMLAATRGERAGPTSAARFVAAAVVIGMAALRPVGPLLVASAALSPSGQSLITRLGVGALAIVLTGALGALGAALAGAAAAIAPSRPRAALVALVASAELAAAAWPGAPGPARAITATTAWLARLGAGT